MKEVEIEKLRRELKDARQAMDAVEIEKLRRELEAARRVVYEAYWHLAYEWQSHLTGDHPARPVEMRVFTPEAYAMMGRSEQELYDALKNYADIKRDLL